MNSALDLLPIPVRRQLESCTAAFAPKACAVYLQGSAAFGCVRPGSVLDLLVLSGPLTAVDQRHLSEPCLHLSGEPGAFNMHFPNFGGRPLFRSYARACRSSKAVATGSWRPTSGSPARWGWSSWGQHPGARGQGSRMPILASPSPLTLRRPARCCWSGRFTGADPAAGTGLARERLPVLQRAGRRMGAAIPARSAAPGDPGRSAGVSRGSG